MCDRSLSEENQDGCMPTSMPSGELKLTEEFLRCRARSTVTVYATAVMERMDEQILPAVYSFVGASFHARPSELGAVTLCRALVQALSSPLGGILGHYCDRVKVTTLGCLLWGCMTAGFGCATSLHVGMLFWAVNGVGLAMVIPSGQSLIADYYSSNSRGKAFGGLYLTGAVGGMLGSLFATNQGASRYWGIEGWRLVFITVAAISVLIGIVTFLLARDPNFRAGKRIPKDKNGESPYSLKEEMLTLLTTPTFLVIILQGILGTIPWTALVFLTLYLQLIGMSDLAASVLMALFLLGTALGGFLGGYIGDRAAVMYPNHGRIFVVQFSVVTGVPFSLLLLKGMPLNGTPGTAVMYAALLFTFGLLKSWSAPAANNPIFAEIVPSHCRNMIYAFDRCFEGALASCAAPLVGLLAEKWFGFSGDASRSADKHRDAQKAQALGNALLVFLLVPWTCCLLFYTGLHYTYPRDKQRAAQWTAARRTQARQLPQARNTVDPERQQLWVADARSIEVRQR